MTKRIFRTIVLVALVVFVSAVTLIMGGLYDYFSQIQQKQLLAETNLFAQGVSLLGEDFFKGLQTKEFRITWIAWDGTILYDSDTSVEDMENPMEHEEIHLALKNGYGESSRYSTTLMKKFTYAAKKLSDGTIVRLCVEQNSLPTLILGMIQPILVITVFVTVLSMALASKTSKKIVAQMNLLNLDQPLSNEGYEEIAPLLHRLNEQQKKLRAQSAELQRKQNEFEVVTGSMKDGLILLDSKGRILSINTSAKNLLKPNGNCIGQNILNVNRSLEMQELLRSAQCGIRAEKILEVDGLRYQLDINPVESKLPESDYILTGYVILMFDVTEKEKSEQMRREFTANVSHELKTPLHSISGCAELLLNDLVRPEDQKQFTKQIYTEAQRMIRLVDDIIGLSHLDEGAAGMKMETIDLYGIAERTIRNLRQPMEKMNVTFNLTGTSTMILGIPHLISGIVYNLCDNAVKYNKPHGTVSVSVTTDENGTLLTVRDTGIGIPPEHQKRVFERFYRVDKSHSKEVGGTGLGLSIVKHAVQIHGAKLELESTPEIGTTIRIIFPKEQGRT